jgi:Leucine-rich repeat (LRR) protein
MMCIYLTFYIIYTESEKNLRNIEAEKLCNELDKIIYIPIKRELSNKQNKVYNDIFLLKEEIIPCLIDKIIEIKIVNDPREEFNTEHYVRTGDIAFFILLDLIDVSIYEIFPEELIAYWQDSGMKGYFRYIENFENRKSLQYSIKDWYNNIYLKNKTEMKLDFNCGNYQKVVIPNFEKLKIFIMNNEKIDKLQNLNIFKFLKYVDLTYNKINYIDEMKNLNNLKGLYLSNNKIECIDNINNLINLKQLNLSNNNIKNIDSLEKLTNLELLLLNNNKIENAYSISKF